ncbi:VOC family protein [Streptomyces sp. NPDC001985]|uniref:VOC family protein n=1 Tax=Streptomyces sp. NPDC001985 TaxID=3154406 RepID=UPI003331A5DF
MAIATLGTVVLDCPDPVGLAGFYQRMLGGEVKVSESDWVELVGIPGVPISFQLAPDHVPPRWGSPEAPQQFHLDLMVPDLDTAEAEILALGAKPLDTADHTRAWRVFQDPAGHPFCLCAE